MTKILALTAALALAALPAFAAELPVPLPDPRKDANPAADATQINADFTLYVGGFLVAQGHNVTTFAGGTYRTQTEISTSGIAHSLHNADIKLSSRGDIDAARLVPAIYVADARSDKVTHKLTLSYDDQGAPTLSVVPPFDEDEKLADVPPDEKIGTQDPISAMIIPATENGDPCDRTIPVFDGRRRYNLTLTKEGAAQITPAKLDHPVDTILCTISYTAVAPIERKRITDIAFKPGDIKVWFAAFDDGRIYMPVRFQIRMPLGGAIMELTDFDERVASADMSASEVAMKEK